MVWDLKYKTVRWHFVESLEPAQVAQVRCSSLVNQGNMYGQVTVRMHTRQVGSRGAPSSRLDSGFLVWWFCFCSAGDRTRGLLHVRELLSPELHPSPRLEVLRKASPWSPWLRHCPFPMSKRWCWDMV